MNRALTALLVAAALSAGCATSPRPFNEPLVSIADLAANADRYHAKTIYVEGYASAGAETNAICADPVPSSRKDCLPLQIDFGPAEQGKVQWQALDGKLVEVRGVFDKTKSTLERVSGAWLEDWK
jgi:hypothetical protein